MTTAKQEVEQVFVHTKVVAAAIKWKHQGARSKWTSPISLDLWDAVDKLEKTLGTETV